MLTFANTEMNKKSHIALATALLVFAGCMSPIDSEDTDQRDRVERRAFEYLQTTVIKSADIDEIGLANTLDTLNKIIARDFGPNERFSYSIAYHVKDPKSPETDPFAGTPQFEDMSRIHLHIQKMRLLDILYEIARQSNSRLRIPTPIIFEIGVDAIKKGEQGGGEERR